MAAPPTRSHHPTMSTRAHPDPATSTATSGRCAPILTPVQRR
jgi:hypothetical protein